MQINISIKRSDVLLVNLEPTKGSEQGKVRPCLVVQNDIANKYCPTTIIAPITSQIADKEYPSDVFVNSGVGGLKENSIVLCNQIRTISVNDRIIKKLGNLPAEVMKKVDDALKVSLGLD